MKRALMGLMCLGFVACAFGDSSNLEGGVLLVHHPPNVQYSEGEDYCATYFTDFELDSCEAQNTRIDLDGNDGESSIWYVLACWDESKEWCGVEFGFGEYDPDIYYFAHGGPCGPDPNAILEITSGDWPGPNAGTALAATDTTWSGSLVPIYWFSGYTYAQGTISLGTDPATDFAGTINCETPPEQWGAVELGGMGIFEDGVSACPDTLLDGGGGDSAEEEGQGDQFEEDENDATGIIIRFAPGVISFPQDNEDLPQFFVASLEDAIVELPSLDTLLVEIGAEDFSTLAPGWRHLTPERSVDFFGNPIDLVDFTDVYYVTLDGRISVEEVIETLHDAPGIAYAEQTGDVTMYDMPTEPEDPYFRTGGCGQWYLDNKGDEGECDDCNAEVDLNMPEAWTICYAQNPPIKAGTKIGVLDEPVNEEHEDLKPFIDTELSGCFFHNDLVWDNDKDCWGSSGEMCPGSGECCYHGTGMAGMAGAGTHNMDENEQEYLGIASPANIPPSHDDRILVALVHSHMYQAAGIGSIPAAVRALEWVCTSDLARGRIRVVNMSWGDPRWKFCHDWSSGEHTPGLGSLRDACRNASRTGVNLVASAGNGGGVSYGQCEVGADTAFVYPAAFRDYCTAVAALGCKGEVNNDFKVGSYIDLAGPGVGYERMGMVPHNYSSNYLLQLAGTSPASAVIASCFALLLGAEQDRYQFYPEDCVALLKASALPHGVDPMHPDGNDEMAVGAGMPRMDVALGWVTEECRLLHGSVEGIPDVVQLWPETKEVMLKNVPPEVCEYGGGDDWPEEPLDLLAYRVSSEVEIDPPTGWSVEMVWPRGVGSTGWRLLDHTLEGSDPNEPAYYDVQYYENWADVEPAGENEYTFTTYAYKIIDGEEFCWVPFEPDVDPFRINYSYVIHFEGEPSGAEGGQPIAPKVDLNIGGTLADGNVEVALSLSQPAEVWLGAYDVDGRLVFEFENGTRMTAGISKSMWDLTDVRKARVPSGVYFIRARASFYDLAQSVVRNRVVVVK